MRKVFCETCDDLRLYTVCEPVLEELEIKGVKFKALQQHAYCEECGEEVFPNDVSDYCIRQAHDAYREAIGSISVSKIEGILKKYNIGAEPLSILLGWGRNTIERQLKHSIPDRMHADRLRALDHPAEMKKLLDANEERISSVAARKVRERLEILLENKEIYSITMRINLMDQIQSASASCNMSVDEYLEKAMTAYLRTNATVNEATALFGKRDNTVKYEDSHASSSNIIHFTAFRDISFVGKVLPSNETIEAYGD